MLALQQHFLRHTWRSTRNPSTRFMVLQLCRNATKKASPAPHTSKGSKSSRPKDKVALVTKKLREKYKFGIESFELYRGISQKLRTEYQIGTLTEIRALVVIASITADRYSQSRRDLLERYAYLWNEICGSGLEFPAPRGFTIVATCTMKDPEWVLVGEHLLDLAVYLEDPLAAMWVCFLNLQNKSNRQRFRSATHARGLLGQLSQQGSDWRATVLEAQQRLYERKSEYEPAMALLEQALDYTKSGERMAELDQEEPKGAPWSLDMVDLPWKALYSMAMQRNLKEKARRAVLIGSDDFDDPEAWVKRAEAGGNNDIHVGSPEWLNLKSKIAMSVISETEETAEAAFRVAMHHLREECWYPFQANEKGKSSRDLESSKGFEWIKVTAHLCHTAKSRYSIVLFAAVLLREWGLIEEGKAFLDEIKLVLATEYDDDQQAEEYSNQLGAYLEQWDPDQPNPGRVPPSSEILAVCWGG